MYGHLSRRFGANWELDLGLRYTVERKTATAYNAYYRDDGYAEVAEVLADFTDRTRYSAPTPRLALSWHPDPRAMVYWQVSCGFKGGSYNVRANAKAYPESVHPLAAETVVANEVGAKTEWLGGALAVNATLFHHDYRNIQLSVLTASEDPRFSAGFPDFRNAGRGTAQGAELEWRTRLGAYLQWSGHAGWLDTRYDRYLENGIDVASQRRFPNAPRLTAGTSVAGDFPLRRAGWLRARIDGRYQSEVWPTTDLQPLLRQGGYALWNASVEWTSPREHWELALRGENLGNRAHRTSGFAYPFGIVTGYYGRPRNWSLTLAYAF